MKSVRRSPKESALPTRPSENVRSGKRLLAWGIPIAVVVLSCAAFLPVLKNDFVNWDDPVNVLDNRAFRGLSWAHLQWMFTTFHNSLYRPLTWMTLGIDYSFWRMNPAGYHLTSLLLHGAGAAAFYFLSARLLALAAPASTVDHASDRKIAAGFAALIFAVHPLRVEPIAWVSGRENVVAAPFFILAATLYLRAVAAPMGSSEYWKWLAAAITSYALSLLGKGAGVTLPIVLLVLDVYPLGRLGGDIKNWLGGRALRVYLEKAPFFLLALVAGLLAIYGKQQSKLMYGLAEYGIAERGVQTVYGLMFYLWKTLLPVDLSNLYEIETLSPLDWRFLVSVALLVGITVGLWIFRRRWPWALAAWTSYIVILLPYAGVAQNGPQIAADRYSYLACLAWAVLAGGAIQYCLLRWRSGAMELSSFALAQTGAALIVLTLGILSWRQTTVWRDSEALWRHALAINDRSFFAHHFLGAALLVKGEAAAAIGYFQSSLKLNPRYASARVGLANALAERGELEPAIEQYRAAIELDGDSLSAHYGLARVLAGRGATEEARQHYLRALAIAPQDPDTHNNLGLLYASLGRQSEAIAHFNAALRADPDYAKAYFNLGRALVREGRLDEAIANLQRALELQPDVAEIHENLARTLALQGKKDQAADHFQAAIRIIKSRPSAQ